MIACEPTLSNVYDLAHDFYDALAQLTGGLMFPLTNPDLLAPLISGFAFEQIALDTLNDEFKEFVLEASRKGENQTKIVEKLQEKLKLRRQTIISAETTDLYVKTSEVNENVKTWLKAENISVGRDTLLGVIAEKRVPDEYGPPPIPWPSYLVNITFKNLGNHELQYSYMEDGQLKNGTLKQNEILPNPATFKVLKPYLFILRHEKEVKSVSRTFMHDQDFEISRYFE